jgi:hypothetical protein
MPLSFLVESRRFVLLSQDKTSTLETNLPPQQRTIAKKKNKISGVAVVKIIIICLASCSLSSHE